MVRRYFLFLIALLNAYHLTGQNCELDPPKDLFISDVTSCSAKLHWTSDTDVKKYLVSFRLTGTTQWSPAVNAGTDTFFNFTGLLPGQNYTFSVKSKCFDGSVSKKKKKSAITSTCTLPYQVFIEPYNSSSVKIIVQAFCSFDTLLVKYSTLTGAKTVVTFVNTDSCLISNLNSDSTYLFEVSTCPRKLNYWTIADTVQFPKQPNIILILVDDSRYDYYSCNGAFPFMQTPNIDRIANEGVNFKGAYVVTSRCSPSRAAIATGLFPLKNGVTDNGLELDSSFITIAEKLHDHGYYTALVGKNDATFQLYGNELDYFLATGNSGDEPTVQTLFNYNGSLKTIDKPNVLTLTDTAIGLIERVNDPFFIWLAYIQPHDPQIPLSSFDGKFDDVVIPWLPDTAKYAVNYPSFLYAGNQAALIHGEDLDTSYRNTLEVVAGLDSCVGQILLTLENNDKLDNTLLIFMSDNGFMMGSHWLNGKTMAYEPSMRIPLFIRYPEWFTPGSVITDRLALNLDIAPTIYEAAGINFDMPLDGRSLRALYEGEFSRTEFYYLMLHSPNTSYPSKRAIRDQHFKYIHYNCNSDTVEELFDMVNDPLELTNLINNHIYDPLIQLYRLKLDSMKLAWNDTSEGALKNCFIKNPLILKQAAEEAEDFPTEPLVYPTITKESVEVYIPWRQATATLYNSFGQALDSWLIEETFSQIKFPSLPAGTYYLNLSNATESVTEKLVILSD